MKKIATRTASVAGDLHQELMNRAYARWQKVPGMSRQDFLNGLSPSEKFAVVTGNLNYQVENGGFGQWFSNRYGDQQTVNYLRKVLTEMGTPAAIAVKRLVISAWHAHNDLEQGNGGDWDGEGDEQADPYDGLDDEFYAINQKFLEDCDWWLASDTHLKPTPRQGPPQPTQQIEQLPIGRPK
jgi:hypothetical protein